MGSIEKKRWIIAAADKKKKVIQDSLFYLFHSTLHTVSSLGFPNIVVFCCYMSFYTARKKKNIIWKKSGKYYMNELSGKVNSKCL